MKLSRKLAFDLTAGILLSSIFCALLVNQIMAGGVGTSITFLAFLSAPENVISTLLMTSFILASWIMRGVNNRMVLFCWALVLVVYYMLFWIMYYLFYYQFLNIYVLNLAGLVASLPVVMLLRYRITFTFALLSKMRMLGILSAETDGYLYSIKTTDFEFYMRQVLYVAFIVEFLNSLYLSLYGLVYQVPFNGSLYEHFLQHDNWDPFFAYVWLRNLIGCTYILIIGIYLFRDNKTKDALDEGVNDLQRRSISLKMLEKRRVKSKKNKNQD